MIEWLYRTLLRLFPREFQDEHGSDAADTFAELRNRSRGASGLWMVCRSFLRLPGAIGAEHARIWREELQRPPSSRPRPSMDRFLQTLRYAFRSLIKAPTFTLAAVLLVGLGVGSATGIFSLVDQLVLRPLPYPHADRLVSPEQGSHSGPLYQAMQELPGFEAWAAGYSESVNLTGEGTPERLTQAWITEDFFEVLGGRAALGRLLEADDFAGAASVVISEGAWRRLWGSDADVVGRTILLDDEPVTVVGVLSDSFEPPSPIVGSRLDVWRPVNWTGPLTTEHSYWILEVVGRLQPGVDIAAAQASMDGMMREMASVHENYRAFRSDEPRFLPLVPLGERAAGEFRAGAGLLLGAVGLLLLVACANVAHLFLARGSYRQRDMAVRRALGADSRTLIGQLMAESALVGAAGGLLGIGVAGLALRAFLAVSPYTLPRSVEVALDPRVLAFTVVLAGLTAIGFGLLPALRSVRQDPGDVLRGATRAATASRSASTMRNGLLVAEIALSLVLVTSAGLLLRSFVRVQDQDPGFDLASVWTVPLSPPEVESAEYKRSMDEIRDALSLHPQVASATYGLTMPLEITGGGRCCWRRGLGPEGDELTTTLHPVGDDYFQTLGIPLRHGRMWSQAEAEGQPVPAVASESFAVALFGSAAAALNQEVGSGDSRIVIVGTVDDVRHYGLDREVDPSLYLPMAALPFPISLAHMAVKLRAPGGPALVQSLREAIWDVAPGLPVPTVRSMEEWRALGSAERRFDALLFGAFGLVALILAAGGLYGTLLYVTSQRQREMAIRMALGATSQNIERWVLRGALAVAAVGVVVGLGGSWVVSRFLESRLFGVQPTDPIALAGASVLLLLAAAAASWLPARRAGKTDPLRMLNAE